MLQQKYRNIYWVILIFFFFVLIFYIYYFAHSFVITSNNVSKFVFSNLPTSLNTGAASSAITVTMTDDYGNISTSSSDKVIRLSTTSSNGKFAQSVNGPWLDNSLDIIIAAGNSSKTFYYYDTSSGNPTITATDETPPTPNGWVNIIVAITIGLASVIPTLFTAAMIKRRRKPWGIVYDSLTNKPIELVIVRVFNLKNDRLIATKVTDQNGRFNFLLANGRYYITVTKTGYNFPPYISKLKMHELATRIGPQSDIYYGQSFTISHDDTNVNLNICLDPKLSTLTLNTKLNIWLKNGFDWFLIALSYLSQPLMIFGAVFDAVNTVIIPSKLNLYLSGFYIVILVFFLASHRLQKIRLGFVFDSETKKPIAGATVAIFDKEYSAIKQIEFTDKHGHFSMLAQKGNYYLTVQAANYEFPSKLLKFQKSNRKIGGLYFGETINNKKAAYVNFSIPLDKS